MMMRSLTGAFLIALFVVSVSAQTAQEAAKATEKTKYDVLLEKVKQKDPSVNFTELRHANLEPTDYESHNASSYAFGCVSADADLFKISRSSLFLCAAEVS